MGHPVDDHYYSQVLAQRVTLALPILGFCNSFLCLIGHVCRIANKKVIANLMSMSLLWCYHQHHQTIQHSLLT